VEVRSLYCSHQKHILYVALNNELNQYIYVVIYFSIYFFTVQVFHNALSCELAQPLKRGSVVR
jgi:hypothetical protein